MRDTEWVSPDKREPGRAKKPRSGLFCKCSFKDAWRRVVEKHGFSAFYQHICPLRLFGPLLTKSLLYRIHRAKSVRAFARKSTI